MKKAVLAGGAIVGLGLLFYVNSKPSHFSEQFIILPSGYQAYCNRQGYREIMPSWGRQLVTDDDGRFVPCDARVGPPWDPRSDEEKAAVEQDRVERIRLADDEANRLRIERASKRREDRLPQCDMKNSSIHGIGVPIPENPVKWEEMRQACKENVAKWYESEIKERKPGELITPSLTYSFSPQKWWESISDDGQITDHTMDDEGNLVHSYNKSTGEVVRPLEPPTNDE